MDYTHDEAAKELGVGRTTVWRKLRDGILLPARTERHTKGKVRSTLIDGDSVRALKASGMADMRRSSAAAVRDEITRRIADQRRRRAKRKE